MHARALVRFGFAAAMIASVAAFVPLEAGAAAAAPPPSTWHLVGHHQHACFDSNVHDAWFGVFIKGTWTHSIEIGMKVLPAGGTYSTSYAPIPAGTANGKYTLAYADAKLAKTTPIGTYKAVLWASDGSSRDQVRVELDVTNDCGY